MARPMTIPLFIPISFPASSLVMALAQLVLVPDHPVPAKESDTADRSASTVTGTASVSESRLQPHYQEPLPTLCWSVQPTRSLPSQAEIAEGWIWVFSKIAFITSWFMENGKTNDRGIDFPSTNAGYAIRHCKWGATKLPEKSIVSGVHMKNLFSNHTSVVYQITTELT